jgi:tetratricopeptide (TPR) repeat protein
LRLTDPRASVHNFEATSGGTKSDARYIEDYHISAAALASGTYMRTLTYHEYLAELLAINGHYFQKIGEYDEAIKYFKRAEQINPAYDYAVVDLMGANLDKLFQRTRINDPVFGAWREDLGHAARYLANAQRYSDRLTELGANWDDYDDSTKQGGEYRHDEFLYIN